MSRPLRDSPRQAAAGRRGRPPVYSEAERNRRVLQAAEQAFTTLGYGAATMEEVARIAGMSKKTIYDLYPDKRHLLAAVAVAADDFPWEDTDRASGACPPSACPLAELRQRLLASVEFALTPRQIRLTRLLIAEAEHAPGLADDFHERVMVKCQSYLAAAVERALQAGHGPRNGDVRFLTIMLLGAALAELHLLALFGKAEKPARAPIAAHVDAVLEACGFSTEQDQARR